MLQRLLYHLRKIKIIIIIVVFVLLLLFYKFVVSSFIVFQHKHIVTKAAVGFEQVNGTMPRADD